MLEDLEVQVRGMHRRLRARFSPTQLFPVTPDPGPTSTPTPANDTPTNPPDNNNPPPTSTPAVTDGPGPASQPASSAASQPTSTAQSTSSTSATSSSSASSSSSTSASSSSSSSSSSTASSASSTPAPTQSQTQQQQPGGLGASIPVVNTSHGTSTVYSSGLGGPTPALAGASTSPTPTSTSSVQVPVVIGIVVAVIAGLAGIIFAVTYFMRRSGRDEEDDILRRQSMVLPDEHTPRGFPPGRGVTPRPPSTVEPHMTGGPVTFGGQQHYVDQGYYGSSYNGGYGAGQAAIPMPPQAWAPVTPHSSQPFFQPMGETPLGSPVTPGPYESAYNGHGQFTQQAAMGAAMGGAMGGAYLERHGSNGAEYMLNHQGSNGDYMLSRQGSTGADVMLNRQYSNGADYMLNRQGSTGPEYMPHRQDTLSPISPVRQGSLGPNTPSRQNSTASTVPLALQPGGNTFLTRQSSMTATAAQLDIPETDYVDLNRSSVSPFQAAQYAEISDRLQSAPPLPLPTPLVAAAADEAIMKEDQVVPTVTEPRPLNVNTQTRVMSPVTSPVLGNAPGAFFTSPVEEIAHSPFSDPRVEHHTSFNVNPDDLPRPPSPAYSSKSRIDSTPPKLPEFSGKDSLFSPVTLEFPSSPAAHGKSPLSASVELTDESHVAGAKASPEPVRHNTKDTHARSPSTHTVYDDDDAYAGI
ncbi:hypothetical protein PsYK624_100340 [Phanerochaete sordida]|uniref:Uncharacterized protein n=1 Tax=Phanerochaete sordida TaxID=48140 RepID=A0A9P3GGH3_9APHY|nr:hypothetical protein PsYK624_100340 [Phanerochaete sordida]